MPNILITTECNLKCPYCFAKNSMDKQYITIDNFIKILDFIRSNRIGILGGEPFLHPEIDKIVDILYDDDRFEDVVIFTNGVHTRRVDKINSSKFRLILNCNPPSQVGDYSYELMRDTFSYYTNINLGVNITKDFKKDYIIDLLLDLKSKDTPRKSNNVRIGVAVPGEKNIQSLNYFWELKPIVFDFIESLANIGVSPGFDCNSIPPCLFLEEEVVSIKNLLKNKKVTSNILSGNRCCFGAMDIFPDLTAIRCFGFSENRVRLEDFDSFEKLSAYFKEKEGIRCSQYVHEICKTCEEFKRSCLGGCLSFDRSVK